MISTLDIDRRKKNILAVFGVIIWYSEGINYQVQNLINSSSTICCFQSRSLHERSDSYSQVVVLLIYKVMHIISNKVAMDCLL